jgi:peptidoglycan/LPS O-acetylase OafA/YrhL
MPEARAAAAHERLRTTKHFRTLDGIRPIAILLVIASHMPEPWWQGLNGYAGVTLFFGLSGFLITTLCLREERQAGRVSIRAFAVRRAFRIFPLYYVVLAAYAVLIGIGVLDGAALWHANLPKFLTYMNELAAEGHYRHTRSLGVEEKFYLLWPLLGFVALPKLAPRFRLRATVQAPFHRSAHLGDRSDQPGSARRLRHWSLLGNLDGLLSSPSARQLRPLSYRVWRCPAVPDRRSGRHLHRNALSAGPTRLGENPL